MDRYIPYLIVLFQTRVYCKTFIILVLHYIRNNSLIFVHILKYFFLTNSWFFSCQSLFWRDIVHYKFTWFKSLQTINGAVSQQGLGYYTAWINWVHTLNEKCNFSRIRRFSSEFSKNTNEKSVTEVKVTEWKILHV